MRAAHEAPDPSARRQAALGGFSKPQWLGLLVGTALLTLLLVTARAADDGDNDEAKIPPLPNESAELVERYLRVQEWKGFFECSETGSVTWSGSYSHGSETIESTAHGQFVLKPSKDSDDDDPKRGILTWTGGNNRTVCGEQIVSFDRQWSRWDQKGAGQEGRLQSAGTLLMAATEFTIWLPTAKTNRFLVHVHAGGNLSSKTINNIRTGRWVTIEGKGDGTQVRRTGSLDETTQSNSAVHWYSPVGDAEKAPWMQVVRDGPGVLIFPFESKTRADTQSSTPVISRRSRVILFPVYDDLEVEITIEGYAKWRPEGSIKNPTEPGNSLAARATLKSKTGKVKNLPEVKRFKFELLGTSREPGVCLNWPLNAEDQDYDLRLAAEAGGKLSAADQKLSMTGQTTDDQGQPYAEARIDSYDFGGRATLQVTCELADGREIMGLMKGEGGGEELVRLPKMKGPGWIADSWRKETKVEGLPDFDDNEKVEGQRDNGDGFTLYEEYRGWVEAGKHIEGDPKRKDLFILNQVGAGGADAIGGIKLFERVSKLATHHRLREAEMATAARLMNGNHRDAPHRVDQHGIWMYNADGTGIPAGGTVGMTSEDAGRAFRPGRVNHVVIESRGVYDATFGHDNSVGLYKLSERDAAFAYDRAVAHELLHAVGVDHHGEGENAAAFFFVSASDPNNPTHRAGFSRKLPKIYDTTDLRRSSDHVYDGSELRRGEMYTLIWEDTKREIAEELAPLYERKLAAERARRAANPPTGEDDAGRRATQFPQYGKSEFYWRETDLFDAVAYLNDEFEVFATIGELNEADSGNELCLMRYYFATAYPVKGKTKTYYVVRPGENRAGRSVCQSPAGTGANASSHEPQSRFGDSAPRRGNCFGDICPNDAIPPRNLY